MLKSEFVRQRKNNGSIIAFNVQNITHLQILKKCADELGKPVIAQFSARYISYWEDRIGLTTLVDRYQKEGVYFHLDHCRNKKLIKFCIDSGFAGVMFDGSSLSIEKNIQIANEIYDYIGRENPSAILEVELGAIVGMEDGVEGGEKADYYRQEDLDVMVEDGNFDIVALAIGNAHGIYETTADVKPQLLKKASNKYPDLNLVLHGGSGLPENMVRQCISFGVVKMNVSTELKIATQEALGEFIKFHSSFNENKWYDYAENLISPFFKKYISKYTT